MASGQAGSSAPTLKPPVLADRGLLERDIELAAIGGLIDVAPNGGRLLAIEGPSGIGKTALISAAKAMGQVAGMRVLHARGLRLGA